MSESAAASSDAAAPACAASQPDRSGRSTCRMSPKSVKKAKKMAGKQPAFKGGKEKLGELIKPKMKKGPSWFYYDKELILVYGA